MEFKKEEIKFTVITLLIIIGISFLNFRISLRKARDAQRNADLGQIYDGLVKFNHDFGFFPPSTDDGLIKACMDDKQKLKDYIANTDPKKFSAYDALNLLARGCQWGEDSFEDVSDQNYPKYITKFPIDPHHNLGVKYFYVSNSKTFQIFAALESPSEPGFSQAIIDRHLLCGVKVCNDGKSSFGIPLEKSLQEYEDSKGK